MIVAFKRDDEEEEAGEGEEKDEDEFDPDEAPDMLEME